MWTGGAGGGPVRHPDRPRIDTIRLPPDRLAHAPDGDERGGGHRHGADIPDNSEFPEVWDDNKIAATVLRATHLPQDVEQQGNGRWRVSGIYEGVDLRVAVNTDGRIWTAYPVAGPGVRANPDQPTVRNSMEASCHDAPKRYLTRSPTG